MNGITRFHSTHSPNKAGRYSIYSELYLPENVANGEPITGSGRLVIEDATDQHDAAWNICRVLNNACQGASQPR
jgi:hypothetical protein